MHHMTMYQEAKNRHNEALANAAQQRLAYEAVQRRKAHDAARNRPRGFHIDLGSLHISVRIAPPSNRMANAGVR